MELLDALSQTFDHTNTIVAAVGPARGLEGEVDVGAGPMPAAAATPGDRLAAFLGRRP